MLRYNDNLPYGLTVINDNIVRKEGRFGQKENFINFQNLINHLISNPDPLVVPIYSFNYLGYIDFFHRYQYDMKRLYMLCKEEKNIIDSCIRDLGTAMEDYEPNIILGKEKYPSLIKFMKEVFDQNKYRDLHSGNFLKDENENYLTIDIEGFVPLDVATHKLNLLWPK